MQHKKQPTVAGSLGDVSVCTSTAKTFSKYFLSHSYIYLVTCRLQCTWTPYYKIKKEKQYHEKKLRSLSKKIVLASEYYYTCVIVLLFIFLRRFITWKLSPDRV